MKRVLITGGNGDIAKAIKNELIKYGEYEIMSPSKSELDVTITKNVDMFFESFVPDVLINNAGFVAPMSIGDCEIDIEKKSIDINLFGTFNCTAAVLKRNPTATVVNIGSSAASNARKTWSSYCASKAGVVMATKCWAEDGFNVVCISPGRTATKMRKGLFPNEDQDELLKPEEFAKIILKAIFGEYAKGSNIDVSKQNIKEML